MSLNLSERSLILLGGGQLAMMLVEAASSLELAAFVFGQSETDPAAQWITAQGSSRHVFVKAPLGTDSQGLWAGPTSGWLSFENEFLDLQKLRVVLPEVVKVGPSLHSLALLQNKYFQKLLFQHCLIGSSEFGDDLSQAPSNVVLKWKRGGYDGKGVLLDPGRDSLMTQSFITKASHGVYWEKRVSFQSELAIQGCFKSGRGFCFPLVKVDSVNGVCFEVRSLQNHPLESEARRSLEKVAATLNYTGVLAMEFFESDGKLLTNEVAPRVHNSGHHTLQSSSTSQFEAHLRAICDQPLEEPKFQPHFGMINWLGHKDFELSTEAESRKEALRALADLGPHVRFKDYLKSEMGPGRKMGHWTWVAGSEAESNECRERVLTALLKWQREFI